MLSTVARFAAGLALAIVVAQPSLAATSPREVVEQLNDTLIAVMRKAETLGFAGRVQALAPELQQSFDFPQMAQVAVSRHWNKLDHAQKRHVIDAFARLSVATFASRFDGFNGESFEVVGELPQRPGVMVVRSRLHRPGGEPVAIDYVLREEDGDWRIIDVLLDGKYSEMATKRSEYSAVVAREGIDRLIRLMEQKTSDMAARRGS